MHKIVEKQLVDEEWIIQTRELKQGNSGFRSIIKGSRPSPHAKGKSLGAYKSSLPRY